MEKSKSLKDKKNSKNFLYPCDKPSARLQDKEKYEIVSEEIKKFEKLVEGHRKLLNAIGSL